MPFKTSGTIAIIKEAEKAGALMTMSGFNHLSLYQIQLKNTKTGKWMKKLKVYDQICITNLRNLTYLPPRVQSGNFGYSHCFWI